MNQSSPTITRVDISELSEFFIGSASDEEHQTGLSVIVAPKGACASVSVRGGGPATRETDLLRPENMVQQIHAVMLSGGSAFGLRAADGVVQALQEANIGLSFLGMCIPIVPGACLFDLLVGEPVAPTPEMGAQAVRDALNRVPLQTGRVGAGCGASVGKLLGPERASAGGLGIAAYRAGDVIVGAIVAVNACGSVVDEQGRVIAGVAADGAVSSEAQASVDERFLSREAFEDAWIESMGGAHANPADDLAAISNTTIGCLFTNAALTKAEACKVADMAHDAYARCIFPIHTPNDGDTIFCMASGEIELPELTRVDVCSVLANRALETAIREAVSA